MTAIKLFGQQTSAFEYIKMMLNGFARKAELQLKIEEIKSADQFIQDNITSVPAIQLEDGEVLYYDSSENINIFIKQAFRKIFTPKNYSELRHFLVPIDFSDASLNAADYALNLAKDLNAIVTIIHCYTPHISDSPIQDDQDKLERVRGIFESIIEVFESEYKQKDLSAPIINAEFLTGFPGELIIEKAEKENATIIMANAGAGNMTKKLFGSVSTSVTMNSKRPVLIIPSDIMYGGINEVAYAMNEIEVDAKVIHQIIDFIKTSYARINLVHVDNKEYNGTGFELNRLYKSNYPKSLITMKNIIHEDIAKGLNEFVANNEIDLLILTHTKKNILESIFTKSVSKEIAITSTTPVLILHEA